VRNLVCKRKIQRSLDCSRLKGMSPANSVKTISGTETNTFQPITASTSFLATSTISNEIMHHMDWLPTLLAAAGNLNIKEQLKEGGVQAIGRTYKVHLDGYNFLPHLTGQEKEGPRREIFYFSDTGELTALRYNDWKAIFMEQKEYATLRAWIEPWTPLRVPLITNLRRDPYERAHVASNTYYDWMIDRVFFLVPAQAYVANFLSTFKEFPL